MFQRLYFHEAFVHLNFRYCTCFEQKVLKLYSADSLNSQTPEPAMGDVLLEKKFLKILLNSQESTCARASFLFFRDF